MAKEDQTTNELMQWVGSPNDARLEHQTKQLLDEHFDDPSLVFKVAALAMARQELCAYPALVKLEEDLYRELFSEKRRAGATNGELVAMGKLLHERKTTAIALAEGNTASAEKPRLQARLPLNGKSEPGVEQFNPTQRQRLRRLIEAEAVDGPVADPAPRHTPTKKH
jgi:hypothetical protein